MERYTQDQIREYWTKQAMMHGQSSSASWSDRMVIELEIKEMLKHLRDGETVLDIGCANGYSTIQFASQKNINIRGIDYIPEMIQLAKQRLESMRNKLTGSVEFSVGNITSLAEPSNEYDAVIVTRVIINLGDWETQRKGLQECVRVIRPGGKLLLSEATLQGWQNLNHFRREWGLPDIPMPSFNTYVDQEQVINSISESMKLLDVVNFASTYYVATRVLKPLLNQALDNLIDVANPSMDWNRWFAQLPAWGDYGTQKLFIFEKLADS